MRVHAHQAARTHMRGAVCFWRNTSHASNRSLLPRTCNQAQHPFTHRLRCSKDSRDIDDGGAEKPSTSGRERDSRDSDQGVFDMAALQRAMARENILEQYKSELENAEPDVLKCALLIAQGEYLDLDLQECYSELDRIADIVAGQLPPPAECYPLRVLQAISKVLYGQLGFRGNSEDYYNADNSYMNRVLQRRTGIPISLSLVYMEVAQRVGMPMVGVNIPAHFMIRPAVGEVEMMVDAFRQGQICSLEDAQDLLSSYSGLDIRLDPKFVQGHEALPPRTFLMRMLNNLKQLYTSGGDLQRSLRTIRFMRITDPEAADEVRDEGLCMYAMRRLPECAALLTEYLKMAPDAADAPRVHALLQRIQEVAKNSNVSSSSGGEGHDDEGLGDVKDGGQQGDDENTSGP